MKVHHASIPWLINFMTDSVSGTYASEPFFQIASAAAAISDFDIVSSAPKELNIDSIANSIVQLLREGT